MASKNTTTVTHPDGTVSKRTSKTREYTHAIQVSPADPRILAAYMLREADQSDAKAAKLRAAADAGQVVVRSRGFGKEDADNFHSHQAILKGTDRVVFTWCSAAGQTESWPDRWPAPAVIVPVKEYLTESARTSAASFEAAAVRLRAEAADILKAGVPVGSWTVERWSSRWDLADKARSTFAYLAERGHQVRVVAVDAPVDQDLPGMWDQADLAGGETDQDEVRVAMAQKLLTSDHSSAQDVQDRAAILLAPVDPSEDCTDLGCCTEVQDLEVTTAEDSERVAFAAANPDARITGTTGGAWEVQCVGGPTCSTWWTGPLETESEARAAYVAHREGRHVRAGDMVTIHRGAEFREVLEVADGLARVVPVSQEDPRDPWWVSLDLVHLVKPEVLKWGQVVELDGERYAILWDDAAPFLRRLRG